MQNNASLRPEICKKFTVYLLPFVGRLDVGCTGVRGWCRRTFPAGGIPAGPSVPGTPTSWRARGKTCTANSETCRDVSLPRPTQYPKIHPPARKGQDFSPRPGDAASRSPGCW